jgi:AcrR family transcriptional regulator
MATSSRSVRPPRHARRRTREREIVLATKALFDERRMQEASVDDIARAVGINKAVVYRHFSSKEELFVVTVGLYLAELSARLRAIGDVADAGDPVARLREGWERFADFCLEFPAFPDCALSLMRRPADELRERVSGAVWFDLGQGMAACLGPLAEILHEGSAAGVFKLDDPDFAANRLYVQTLGTMHLARIGVGVKLAAPGVPGAFAVTPEQVRDACVRDTLAAVGVAT